MDTALQIKQPKPNILGENKIVETPRRVYNAPSIGIVQVPSISTTPISDAITITKQEHPKIRYKLTTNKFKNFKSENFLSAITISCGLAAGGNYILKGLSKLIKLIKKAP